MFFFNANPFQSIQLPWLPGVSVTHHTPFFIFSKVLVILLDPERNEHQLRKAYKAGRY